jgi:uncharacterized membrane protein
MPDLIAIVYSKQETAFEARERLIQLQSEYLLDLADAVVATKDAEGKVELHQLLNTVSAGAMQGGFWGSLIGLLFMNPLLGLMVGAGAGALSGKFTDYGIPDDRMKELAQTFQPGTAGLFVLLRKVTADKVAEELGRFGGTILRTSLSHDEEQKLRQSLTSQLPREAAPTPAAAP